MLDALCQALSLSLQPVAVWRGDSLPAGVPEAKASGCIVPDLMAAAHGTPVAFRRETVGCPGGKRGLGLTAEMPEYMACFLSTGTGDRPGMAYKKDPDLAAHYLRHLPTPPPAKYVAFWPLDRLPREITPWAILFLVDPQRLSALVTLANFDRADGQGVEVRFGAGCAQAVLYSLCHAAAGEEVCTIGLTDPSARVHLEDGNLLSFSVPYRRCLALEEAVKDSFLVKGTWRAIQKTL